MRGTVSFLVIASVFLPAVGAHIAHPTSSTVLDMGGFKLAITPSPSPVLAGAATRFVLIDVQEDPERPLPGASIRITAADDRPVAQHEFQRNGSLWETPPILFEETGMFSGRIILDPENPSEGRFSFDIYRMLPFEFAPIDATSDPVALEPYRLTFQTVERENGRPKEYVTDLRAMIFPSGTSPANGDHYENVTFAADGTANWSAMFTFGFAGPWRIQLASESGGFGMMEVPPWQVDVLPSFVPETSSPSAEVALSIALVFALAVVVRGRARAH